MQRIFQVNYPCFISVLQFIIRPCQQIFFFTRKIIILFTAYNFRYFYNETKKGWKKEKREYGRLESNKNTGNYNSNKTRSCGIYACMFLPLTTAHASHDREIKRIKNVFLEKEEGKKKKKKKFIERFLHDAKYSFDKYSFHESFHLHRKKFMKHFKIYILCILELYHFKTRVLNNLL